MTEETPPGGHRMVLAIMELADPDTAELAAQYEETVVAPNVEWDSLNHVRQRLWERLIRRGQRGEVVFKGVRSGGEGPVLISGGALRGSKPDYLADTLEAAGIVFHAVGVFEATQDPAPSTSEAAPGEEVGNRKGRGGPSGRYDWPAFQRELTRALFEGGLPDRRAIRRHMLDWCKRWDPTPDESRVRQKLDEYWHPDIPDKAER